MIALAWHTRAHHLHVVDLPYRLSSWGLDDPLNTRLWYAENGALAAWAVLQAPFWTVDIVCQPGMECDLFPRILDWADGRISELPGSPYYRESWFVNIFNGQADRFAALERSGYTCQSHAIEDPCSKVWMRREGSPMPRAYPAPPGFSARPLCGSSEVPAYVALHQKVFGSPNMTVEWRQRTLRHSGYNPQLDIVVQTPDGSLGAFCIGWLGCSPAGELVGQIEPLGCHPDFRSYALGRVALAEVIQRLIRLGARRVYVETDNYRNTAMLLYQSFEFKLVEEVLVFGREYPLPGATS